MKFKAFCVMLFVLLSVSLVISCGGGADTTATPETDPPAVTTTAGQTTTAVKTTQSTTKATTTATVKATTAATTKASVGTTVAATTTRKPITKVTVIRTTTVATTTVSPYENVPTALPNGSAFDSTVIFDGNAESYATLNGKTDNGSTYDITTLPDGNKVFAYHVKKVQLYGTISVDYTFNGNEAGFLFYLDASNSAPYHETCFGPLFNIGGWNQTGSHANSIMRAPDEEHNYIYYLTDGTTEWVKSENYDNCRAIVGSQFSGWIFVPLDQLSMGGTNEDFVEAGDVLTYFRVYCPAGLFGQDGDGNYPKTSDTAVDIYFDNLMVVTAK